MTTVHDGLPFRLKTQRTGKTATIGLPFGSLEKPVRLSCNYKEWPVVSTTFPIPMADQFFLDNGVGKFNISYFLN